MSVSSPLTSKFDPTRISADSVHGFGPETFVTLPPTVQHLARGLPVEFHCHGIGSADFSDLGRLSLSAVEEAAAREGVRCVPTLYLPFSRFEAFLAMMQRFSERRADGLHENIVGFAVEGPMLGSFGGTPEDGVWLPTRREWLQLAECGPLGLRYVVISPDALLPDSPLAAAKTLEHPELEWIVRTLLEHGVRPALGHFLKTSPEASAECVQRTVESAREAGARPFSGDVTTDHLFNDMPLRFVHAWRTRQDRERRQVELAAADLASWSIDTVLEQCGPVPGTIMREAHLGGLVACLNFDGEHVDIEVAKRAAELIGSRSVIAMTDRTDRPFLGSQALSRRADNSLYYQAKGIVAAGSRDIDAQIDNMRHCGISEADIWTMVMATPSRVLGLPQCDAPQTYLTCIGTDGKRYFRSGDEWATPCRETFGSTT